MYINNLKIKIIYIYIFFFAEVLEREKMSYYSYCFYV